jgi:hypothetical protein
MKRKMIVCLTSAILSTSVLAVDLDISGAVPEKNDSSTITLKHVNVPGLGIFSAQFKWSPQSLGFIVVPSSVVREVAGSSGEVCTVGLYTGLGGDYYLIATWTVGDMEFGGVVELYSYTTGFIASWAKGPLHKNPYLAGQDISTLQDGRAYGVMGPESSDYSGFSVGNLIETVRNPGESGQGFSIRQINNGAGTNFNSSGEITYRTDCSLVQGGEYMGITGDYYVVSGDSAGGGVSGRHSYSDDFNAGWSSAGIGFLPGYQYGAVSAVSSSYTGFTGGDSVFGLRIGNGVSVTAFDKTTGKVKSTAVFIKP